MLYSANNWIDELESIKVVRPGSRVTMEIEVTGTPLPEVKWSKDGHPGNNE